jgi:hypothetical protein
MRGIGSKLFSPEELKTRDKDTLKAWLRDCLGGYVVAIKNIEAGGLLYRGVICDDQPHKISRISYPPVEAVKEDGRLNRAGTSMFYCTAGREPVLYELRASQGERIALSTWEVTEPLWMHFVGYHDSALGRMGAPIVGPRLQLINPIPNESKFNKKLRKRLALAFTENVPKGTEYRYKQSIAINELLFDKAEPMPLKSGGPRHTRAAGTVYPSRQLSGRADNVAILPEFVESSLRIKSVDYISVDEVDDAISTYTIRRLATSQTFSGDCIIWNNTTDTPEHPTTSEHKS